MLSPSPSLHPQSPNMSLSHSVKIIPFFTTPHLRPLLDFYKTHLPDFTISAHPDDSPEPTFASIAVGPGAAANIYILQDQDGKRARGSCMIMLYSLPVLEEFYGRVREAGARMPNAFEFTGMPVTEGGQAGPMVGPLEDKEWGYRQFDLVDLHGNMIVFFAFLEEE